MSDRWTTFYTRLIEGLNIGVGMAISLIAIIIALLSIIGNQQQESLSQLSSFAANAQGANSCTLAAPTVQIELPDGHFLTIRDEGWINQFCLMAVGYPAFDVNGDGLVDSTPDPALVSAVRKATDDP